MRELAIHPGSVGVESSVQLGESSAQGVPQAPHFVGGGSDLAFDSRLEIDEELFAAIHAPIVLQAGLTGMLNGGLIEALAQLEDVDFIRRAGALWGTRTLKPMERMTSATIKLFLPRGDAKSLRTAEISNWTGKAVAAPRTELDELLAREELDKAGVYILIGSDLLTNTPTAYIGEAEIIRERIKQHKTKEWVSAIVFVSKDENLTKAHVRYLESRLLAEAAEINRFTIEQNQAGGSRLPESDREDMEVFLARIRQLLPVLGSDILVQIAQPAAKAQPGGVLFCRIKGAEAQGQRTASGFIVFRGSSAVLEQRPCAESYPYVVAQRNQLRVDGTLIEKGGFLIFAKDAEFSSPSAAAAVIHGGSANGLVVWKSKDGKSLKQLDEQS